MLIEPAFTDSSLPELFHNQKLFHNAEADLWKLSGSVIGYDSEGEVRIVKKVSSENEVERRRDGEVAPGERFRFSSLVFEYVTSQINLADQKASFVFAAAAAMLAFLQSQNASDRWKTAFEEWGVLSVCSLLSMSLLAITVLMSARVIYPRFAGMGQGIVFWREVIREREPREYSEEVQASSDSVLVESLSHHVYELSSICDQKFRSLRFAFRCATGGFSLAVVFLVFS